MADSALTPGWRDIFKSRTGVFPETLGLMTEDDAQKHLLALDDARKAAPAGRASALGLAGVK